VLKGLVDDTMLGQQDLRVACFSLLVALLEDTKAISCEFNNGGGE
jgi:hypothetical protein